MIPEGEKISFDQLIDQIDSSKVIFVAEAHDQIEQHHIELRILQGLLAKGKDLVVGMEMFHRSQQLILDRWSQGGLTEGEFRK
ncbi:MAG: ChaN family lipoprotein [Deltaproteobacteria bacterium]